MKSTRLIVTLCILLLTGIVSQGQESVVTIAFDCQQDPPSVTLLDGKGTLYHYRKEQTKFYRSIYYLHTDAQTIKIDPQSKLSNGYYLAFNTSDHISTWYSNNKTLGNDVRISQSQLNSKGISFRWEEHADVLISTKYRDNDSIDNKHRVYLVVLPTPPKDTLISSVEKDIVVDKRRGTIRGSVTLHRTGRIIIDSVFVEGVKAKATYSKDHLNRDVPYYGNNGFAEVEIRRPWPPRIKELNLTIYHTLFNSNGDMTPSQMDLKIDLFEGREPFFAKYWWVFVLLGLAGLVLILIINWIRRNNDPDSVQHLRNEIKQLTKENERLSRALVFCNHQLESLKTENTWLKKQENNNKLNYIERIDELEKEVKRLSQPTQAAIDEAAFLQKCDQLIEEIEIIRRPLHGNPALADLDEKLRQLEKIIINTKQ